MKLVEKHLAWFFKEDGEPILLKDANKFLSKLISCYNFTGEPCCPELFNVEWTTYYLDKENILKYEANFNDFTLILFVQEPSKKCELKIKIDDKVYTFPPDIISDEEIQIQLQKLQIKIEYGTPPIYHFREHNK